MKSYAGKKVKLSVFLTLLASASAGMASAQNLVLNGNFALPAVSYANVNPGTTGSPTTPIDDFTVDNGGATTGLGTDPDNSIQLIGAGYSGSNGFGTFTGGTGAQVVQLTNYNQSSPVNPGGLNQTVTTVIGDTYEFTLDYSARNSNSLSSPIATGIINFGGETETLTATSSTFTTSTPLYLVATSTSTLIDITATDLTTGPTISNEPLVIGNLVMTQQISAPEPATALPLFAACAAMVLFFFRRRFSLTS